MSGKATGVAAAQQIAWTLDHARAKYQQGHLLEAERLCRAVIAQRPKHFTALTLLGFVLVSGNRTEEAARHFHAAAAIDPASPIGHLNEGTVLASLGRTDDAVVCFRRTLTLRPDYPEALYNLTVVLTKAGRLDDAVASCREALARKRDYPEAHNYLGNALANLGRLDEAMASYHAALALKPNYAEAHSNLGNALLQQERLDEAIASCRRSIALKPELAEAHNNLGTALKEQMRLDEAVGSFRTSIAHKPDHAEAHSNLGIMLLAQGDMAVGWTEYEWRWKTSQMTRARRDFAQSQWHGEAAAGQWLLVHAEQGFGDTLQFCRYATLAAANGLRVIMEVQKPLARLLRDLPGVDIVVARGEDLPDFDLHCPMLSMPSALGTSVATIPSTTAYLHADAAQAARWRKRLAAMENQGRRIGLVWAGNPRADSPVSAVTDRRRSVAVDRLAILVEVSGLHFFSLQKDGPAAPAEVGLTNFMGEMADFADTAALIVNLDLVITVDTAVAHLAAALGKPVWLLNRFDSCWRWFLERRDSPWYPTLRIYRQQRSGDWDSVLAEVALDLRNVTKAGSVNAWAAAVG